MLAHLIRFSIRHYGVVITLATLIILYGSYNFFSAGLDIFPEFAPKQVIIQTESPGLSSEQVEFLVTQKIEFAISGVNGLLSLRSESIHGLSVVTAIFPENSDIYRNRQLITERISQLTNNLPKGITPVVVPLSSSSATVLTLGLSSEKVNLMELRSLVDWTIAPRLLAISGVADVNIFGGGVKQLQIQVDIRQLQRFNLGMDDVIRTVSQATNQVGSGFIETDNQRFTIQVKGLPTTPDQFNTLIITHQDGRNIYLNEIATVAYAPKPAISAAQIMGKPGIIVMVIAQYGANTLTVSKTLEKSLAEMNTSLAKQGIQFYPHLFRPADYIERSINNLSQHLLIGGIFVILILLLFLFNFRAALISALAIPVSLLGAVTVLLAAGVNLNIMVLGGLAIALGEVVDDAIIDTENIFRRLRENKHSDKPLAIDTVILNASLEVRSSVVYASFIVALVFVPLLTLEGVAGRLFAPLGVSYILAILLSLLVALTLTPALCHALLGLQKNEYDHAPIVKRIQHIYQLGLSFTFRHSNKVFFAAFVFFITAFIAVSKLDHKFLPELREGHFILHTTSIPGTSLGESIRMGSRITQRILSIKGVESVSQWAGRAERGADTYGSHYSEYEIRLSASSGQAQQLTLDAIRDILSNFPGISYEVNTFLTERVDETISGYTAPVVVNLFGNDLSELDNKAQTIAKIIASLPGADNVLVRSPPELPFLQILIDQEKMNFWGITSEKLLQCLQSVYETTTVGKIYEGNRIVDIAATIPNEQKKSIDTLSDLPLLALDGKTVKLSQIADISTKISRYNILRQKAQRKQTITANIINEDMDVFVKSLKKRIQHEISLSPGMYLEYSGAAVEQKKTRHNLIINALLAGSGVLILIFIAIGNLRQVLLTLFNLPFALSGGVFAMLITSAPLSIGSVVGFITLFGITVRNTIMLISHCNHLVNYENLKWNKTTITSAALQRLPSILMTALVTALAMLPIAINSDNPGSEIMGPMATIIIGGLISSTVLNLLLLPTVLLRIGKPSNNTY